MYATQTDLAFKSQQHAALGNHSASFSSAAKWREELPYMAVDMGGSNKIRMNLVPDTAQAFSNVAPFPLDGN